MCTVHSVVICRNAYWTFCVYTIYSIAINIRSMDGGRIKLTSTTASGRRPHIPPICVNVLYKIIILTLENERFNSSNYF